MHEIEIYVRFSETDAAGHVNNASYFFYFEEARIKLIEQMGYKVNGKISMSSVILASTTCDYISQAYAGQTLKLKTSVAKVGNKSFTLNHLLTQSETDTVVARASATLVCFNFDEQKSETIPEEVREILESNLVM